MIVNLFKPSQVSTARYLSIIVSITIKFSYIVCSEVVGFTARNQLLVQAGGNIQQLWGSS